MREQKLSFADYVDLNDDKETLYKYIHSMNGVGEERTYDPEHLARESHEFSIVVMKEQLL